MTSIEWTDETWNPIVGCSRVSKGCEHCYAERVAHRGMSPQHRGLTVLGAHGPRWTGEVRLVEDRLAAPLSWRKPRRVFVNSMSDLFHDGLTNEQVAAVFGVMAACPHLTFQVLTKRPQRFREWFAWIADEGEALREQVGEDPPSGTPVPSACAMLATTDAVPGGILSRAHFETATRQPWPLANVWLGVSVEDQATADERIPLLLDTPAARRWVSYEPAIGPVTFRDEWLSRTCALGHFTHRNDTGYRPGECAHEGQFVCGFPLVGGLDWIVVGGESGPGARPFDLAWARSAIAQCRSASVPCFVKQLGAQPVSSEHAAIHDRHGIAAPCLSLHEARLLAPDYDGGRVVHPAPLRLRDRKGGDLDEWPADLRVREMPEVRR
jgi:protein gp37